MRAFLNKLLPRSGYPIVWVRRGDVKYNLMYDSIEAMAEAIPYLDTNNDAVYFAVATYREKRKEKKRTAENVLSFKTLWLDIDVEANNPAKYPSLELAIQALQQFINATGMPVPMIVQSGGGLHVYWPLIEEITVDQWRQLPSLLIATAHATGFLIDAHCVKLPTQVLRPIGTHHRKDPTNPIEVTLLQDAEPSNFEYILSILNNYVTSNNIEIVDVMAKERTPDSFQLLAEQAGWTYNPVVELRSAPQIIEQCKQMRLAANAGEPVWRGMLSIMRLCENGREYAHELSQEDPRYDYSDTEAKLDALDIAQGPQGMPMRCDGFKGLNPGGCEGCTANVTSPIVLGIPDNKEVITAHEEEVIVPDVIPEVVYSNLNITPPPNVASPPPFNITTAGGQFSVAENGIVCTQNRTAPDGSVQVVNSVICRQRLYPIKYIYSVNAEGNKEFLFMWRIEDPKTEPNDCVVSAEIFHQTPSLVAEFSKFGVVIENQNHFQLFGRFMRAFISTMMEQHSAQRQYETFGWQETGDFVCGKNLVTPEGQVQRAVLNDEAQDQAFQSIMEPTGDFDKWRNAIEVFNKPGQEHAQLAICASFAGPLMVYTGIRGFLLSLVGSSGAGKSTIQEAAASVWGSPKPQLRAAPGTKRGDSDLSVIRSIGVNKHIPVQMEEITNMPNDTVSDFVYSLSLGSEKSRLKQTTKGYARNAGLHWQTVFVSSSNKSVRDKLSAVKTDYEAESMRLFEIANIPTLVETDMVNDTQILMDLEHNFGHAGLIYVKYLQANKNKLKDWVNDRVRWLTDKVRATQQERFWVQGLSAWFVGIEIAKAAGLHDFDLERLENYVLLHYFRQRRKLTVTKDYASTSFSEMVNGLLGEAVVVSKADQAIGLTTTHLLPRTGRLTVRVELDTCKGFISSNRVRQWANTNDTTVSEIINNGIDSGYMIDDSTVKTMLGAGVSSLGGSGEVRCYPFKLKDSESEILQQQINKQNEEQDNA